MVLAPLDFFEPGSIAVIASILAGVLPSIIAAAAPVAAATAPAAATATGLGTGLSTGLGTTLGASLAGPAASAAAPAASLIPGGAGLLAETGATAGAFVPEAVAAAPGLAEAGTAAGATTEAALGGAAAPGGSLSNILGVGAPEVTESLSALGKLTPTALDSSSIGAEANPSPFTTSQQTPNTSQLVDNAKLAAALGKTGNELGSALNPPDQENNIVATRQTLNNRRAPAAQPQQFQSRPAGGLEDALRRIMAGQQRSRDALMSKRITTGISL